MPKNLKITKEFLEQEYFLNNRSTVSIARILKCSQSTVHRNFRKFGIKIRGKGHKYREDLLNRQCNTLKVIDEAPNYHNSFMWKCECQKCKRIKIYPSKKIKDNLAKCYKCEPNEAPSRDKAHYWSGCGELSGEHYTCIRRRAELKNREFNITRQYLWELFLKQERKCALTGELLKFETTSKNRFKERTASLDRIDSSKGYTEDNVQWIHKDINKIKREFKQEYLIELCQKIMNYQQKKNSKENLMMEIATP